MARLPEPGGDAGNWGEILNDFLRQEHNDDGSLKHVARPSDLTKENVGLGNVANLAPEDLPVSSAALLALQERDREIARITRGNRTVVAIGDSITSTGNLDRNYVNHARRYLDGIVDVGAKFAGGGYRVEQIEDTFLPNVLMMDPTPSYCVVLAGTNNLSNEDAPTIFGRLRRIYDALAMAGITPVVCALTPRNEGSAKPVVHQLRQLLGMYALSQGYPFCDFPAVTMDPDSGGWLSGYNLDSTHPDLLGALAMGKQLAGVLQAAARYPEPPLALTDDDSTNLFRWPVFGTSLQVDAFGLPRDGDGRRGLYANMGDTSDWSFTYEADPGNVVGRWLKIEHTASVVGNSLALYTKGGNYPANPGDLFAYGFKYQIVQPGPLDASPLTIGLQEAVSPYAGLQATGLASTGTGQYTSVLPLVGELDTGIRTFYMEGRVPVSNTTNQLRLGITSDIAVGGIIRIGQITIRNLTQLGLD